MKRMRQRSHTCESKNWRDLSFKYQNPAFFSLDKREKSEIWGAIVGTKTQIHVVGFGALPETIEKSEER